MEASFFSKPLSQSECRIKITSQLLSESECRNLGRDLTQKTHRSKMAEVRHNADKHYLLHLSVSLFTGVNLSRRPPPPVRWKSWGHAWQERRPLQWVIRILLECILVSTRFTAPLRNRNKFIIPEQFLLYNLYCF